MATLYIIQGFIASGKTTYSKKLAKQTHATHLNPDEQISKLFSKENYMNNWNECFDQTTTYLWDKAKKLLLSGQDVIFDMGFWHKKDRDFARKLAKDCNSECKHIYLYVPDEILKERIVSSRPPEWAEKHLKNFEKNKQSFEEPTDNEVVEVIKNF